MKDGKYVYHETYHKNGDVSVTTHDLVSGIGQTRTYKRRSG
ncbi:hypothetical protein [Clostridium sp.]